MYFRWRRQHACGLSAPGRGKGILSGHKDSSAGNLYIDFPLPDDHTTSPLATNSEFHQHPIRPRQDPDFHSNVRHIEIDQKSVGTTISEEQRRRPHFQPQPWIVAPGESNCEKDYSSN